MIHLRAVVHVSARDEAAARRVIAEIERRYTSLKPEAPYVAVVGLDKRDGPPPAGEQENWK